MLFFASLEPLFVLVFSILYLYQKIVLMSIVRVVIRPCFIITAANGILDVCLVYGVVCFRVISEVNAKEK